MTENPRARRAADRGAVGRAAARVCWVMIAFWACPAWGQGGARGASAEDAGGGSQPGRVARLPTVAHSSSGTIDIRAMQTRLADLLQKLAETTDRNIVIGAGVDDRRVTVSIRGMTLTEVLEAVLPGAGCGYRDNGKYILVDSLDALAAREAVAEEPLEVRVVPLRFVSATEAMEMIQPFLSDRGQVVATPEPDDDVSTSIDGGDVNEASGGQSNANRDVLVIEDTRERMVRLLQIIRSIDVQPTQVLVEATILRSVIDDENQLGIDLNFLGGVDFQTVGATSTGGTNLTPGQIPAFEFEDGVAALTQLFGQPPTPGGFTFGLIKNNLAVFISALEELTDTVVLANPKILALNKQRGRFIVGRRDGFVTTTLTQTTAVQTVQYLETGTQLSFRPFILNGDHVRMEIHVEDSAGGLNPSNLPFENTTESTTNIIVEDGHTILIGGLFRSDDTASRSQVPGLGELPGIGAAFRRSQDRSQREEVMVLLTVHVIKNDPVYQELGKEMLGEANRLRIGARDRMLWFGRQKLAEAHARSAVDLMNAGRRDRALFHARLAVSADPRQPTARRLLGKLEGRSDTIDPDNGLRQWVARRLNGWSDDEGDAAAGMKEASGRAGDGK